MGFIFVEDGRIITFNGMGGLESRPDIDFPKLDKLMIGADGKSKNAGTIDTSVQRVTGTCSYSIPYKGKATIFCDGTISDGEAKFISNGKPPHQPR